MADAQQLAEPAIETAVARQDPPFVSEHDKVVVVLGAGASISEMLTTEQHPLPPTDANFLEIARDCANAKYEEMEAAFHELWNGNEPWPLKYQKMEALFSSAYLRVQQSSGTSKEGRAARRLYDSLVEMLRDTLSDTTGKARPHQHLQFLSSIANRNPKSLQIVSFNYDVLADRALLEGARQGVWNWSHTDGYGFKPTNQPTPRAESDLKLLKLHGSMNWYIPTPGRTRANVYVKKTPVYVPNPASNPEAVAWQRRQHHHGHSNRPIFPLMVPPVFEKGNQIVGVLQNVWSQASKVLREASIVYVWGYSLPQTDYHAEVLFAQNARRARHHLVAINPDRTSLGRVTDVCGHTWNRWYFEMRHLIRETGNGA
jgi:NAD-dependent SIR2 family protein deacetylase